MVSANHYSHSPRTIGIFHSRIPHPHPFPRSPPVPLNRLAPLSALTFSSSRAAGATPSARSLDHPNSRSWNARSRIGWQGQRRQELMLGAVEGHLELVPTVVQLQQPMAYSQSPTLSFPLTPYRSPAANSEQVYPSPPIDPSISSSIPSADGTVNFGTAHMDEPSVDHGTSPTSSPENRDTAAHSSSSTARLPQFYVAVILGSIAALACLIAVLAFFIRRRTRQRRNSEIFVPWDAASSVWSREKDPSVDDEEAAWKDSNRECSLGSRPYNEFYNAEKGPNLAGVGLGRMQVDLPKLPSPIPTTTPFFDIALSPSPQGLYPPDLPGRPPLPHNGTLLPVPMTTGDLMMANYVKGDGASLSSLATTPATTPRQSRSSRSIGPVEGLPTPDDLLIPPAESMRAGGIELAVPARASCRDKSHCGGHDTFGTPRTLNQATPPPSRIVDRLRAARHWDTVTSPNANTGWSSGLKIALELVSPYLYAKKDSEESVNLTPAPKRVVRERDEDKLEGFVGGELVGLPIQESGRARKMFKVGKLSRSSTRPTVKNLSTMSGLGIYGVDRKVFTLRGSGEEPCRVKRMSRVKGPRRSKE